MAEQTATFGLKIDSDAGPAKEAAAELEKFRAAIAKSQDAIASYRKSMSLLKGSSAEITDAKAKLKAAIAAEQAAITKNNLAVLKLGGSYDKLQKAHKKENEVLAAGKKALSATGGPLKDLSDRFETLKGILGEVSSGWGLLAVGAVGAVAAIIAITVATVAFTAKLTEWTVRSADALRNMQLMREAASGNAKDATAWGHQIDWLSLRVATSKDKLNELAVSTEKSFRGTRVSGQGMIDIWKSVAVAGAAMGDDVGRALQTILERGKMTGRLGIDFKAPGISELQGTGITFQQVAKQLAKDLNIGLNEAQAALVSHRVTMDAGARAIREVVEQRFADINAKKLLSLDGIFTKLQDNVRDWAKDLTESGGALEPLLKGLKQIVDMTGLQTESGQKMKKVIGEYATAFTKAVTENLPLLKQLVGGALELGGWIVRVTRMVVAFGTSWAGIQAAKGILIAIAAVLGLLVVALGAVGLAVWAVGEAFLGVWQTGEAIGEGLYNAFAALAKLDWAAIGKAIIEGIKSGLFSAWESLKGAVANLAEDVKKAFSLHLKIGSPSKVFAEYGKMTGVGYAQGVNASSREAQAATVDMVAVEPPASEGSGAGGRASSAASVTTTIAPQVSATFHIHAPDAHKAVEMIQSSSILDDLTHAVQTALRGISIPTGTAPAAGG